MTEESSTNAGRLDALVDAALAVHGARLDESQRVTLRLHAERLRDLAAELDRYTLANADEPDSSFHVIDQVDAV